MMIKLVLFFGCFAVSFAQAPVACSTPLQWESRRVKAVRERQFIEVGQYSYDAVNERTRAAEEVYQGQEREFFDVLHLYKENKEYRVNVRTRNCTVGTPPHPFFKVGIPSGAMFLFETEVGAAGVPNEHLVQQTWETKFSNGATYGISVTVPDCIPINAFYDNKNLAGFETYSYFNVRAGIKDPAVFNVPSECAGL